MGLGSLQVSLVVLTWSHKTNSPVEYSGYAFDDDDDEEDSNGSCAISRTN